MVVLASYHSFYLSTILINKKKIKKKNKKILNQNTQKTLKVKWQIEQLDEGTGFYIHT